MAKVELKICERCGGLWFRPQGSQWVYCAACHERLLDMPKAAEKPSQKRPRVGLQAEAA